jgi:hypothetical protein
MRDVEVVPIPVEQIPQGIGAGMLLRVGKAGEFGESHDVAATATYHLSL